MMTPAQFRDAIAQVGLSQQKAGVWFGKSKRTGQRWASGDYEVPVYVARFLRFMVKAALTPDDIVNPRPPRQRRNRRTETAAGGVIRRSQQLVDCRLDGAL